MSIKNILCAYSGEAARGSGLRHAIKLALHSDAWLTGVLRHGRPALEERFAAQIPEHLIKTLREQDRQQINEVKERFDGIVAEAGLSERAEYVDLDAERGESLSELARSFDLVVTGLHSGLVGESHMSANPDLIALRSGRPVLIVPDGYTAEGLADHALVAWDGKRSAARAIGDAMTILEEKARVTILTVGSTPAPGTDMLMRNLQRHNVNAELVSRPRQKSIAHTILAAADELGAKLIVMGAFEHSKFSHDLMGGVTTDVMRDAKVPVFMSH